MHCINPHHDHRFQKRIVSPNINYFGPKIFAPRHHHQVSLNSYQYINLKHLLPHTGNFSRKHFGSIAYGNFVVKKIKHECGRYSYVIPTFGVDPNALGCSESRKNEHINHNNKAKENDRPPSTNKVHMSPRVEYHGKHLGQEPDDSQQKTVPVSIDVIKKTIIALRTDLRIRRAIQKAEEDMETEEMMQTSKSDIVTNKVSQSGYLKEAGSQTDLNMSSEQKKRKSCSKGVQTENDDKTPAEIQIPPLKTNASKRNKTRHNLVKEHTENQAPNKKKKLNALKTQQEDVDSHIIRPITKIGLNENKQAKTSTAKAVDIILEELDKFEIMKSHSHFEETLSQRYEEAATEPSEKAQKDILDQAREIPDAIKEERVLEENSISQNQVHNQSVEIMSIKSKDEENINNKKIIVKPECIDNEEEDIEEHIKEHHDETFDHSEMRIDVEALEPFGEGFEQNGKENYQRLEEENSDRKSENQVVTAETIVTSNQEDSERDRIENNEESLDKLEMIMEAEKLFEPAQESKQEEETGKQTTEEKMGLENENTLQELKLDCREAMLECDEVLELKEKKIKEKEGLKLCNKNKSSIESLEKLQKISEDKANIEDETKEKENAEKSEKQKAITITLFLKWDTITRRRKRQIWQLGEDSVTGKSHFNPNYITELPQLVSKDSSGQKKRILKLVWDPTSVREEKLRKYFKKLEKALGCDINQEKAIKLLQNNGNKTRNVWEIIESNERAYSMILGV